MGAGEHLFVCTLSLCECVGAGMSAFDINGGRICENLCLECVRMHCPWCLIRERARVCLRAWESTIVIKQRARDDH